MTDPMIVRQGSIGKIYFSFVLFVNSALLANRIQNKGHRGRIKSPPKIPSLCKRAMTKLVVVRYGQEVRYICLLCILLSFWL